MENEIKKPLKIGIKTTNGDSPRTRIDHYIIMKDYYKIKLVNDDQLSTVTIISNIVERYGSVAARLGLMDNQSSTQWFSEQIFCEDCSIKIVRYLCDKKITYELNETIEKDAAKCASPIRCGLCNESIPDYKEDEFFYPR